MGFAREVMQKCLYPLESLLVRVAGKEGAYPPVFIIGAPRSSSTLVYQSMVAYFDVGYITNFTRNFYRVPLSGILAQRIFFGTVRYNEFKSRFGRTEGQLGPNEAADFWYQWFPRGKNVYVEKGATPREVLVSFRKKVLEISAFLGKPVIFKNLYNSMRINPIMEALPESFFVVCRRNPVDIAQSILRSREIELGTRGEWWSVPPKEIEKIEQHDPVEQVVEQVYYIYKQIEEDLKEWGVKRVYYIDYEEFCRNPSGLLLGFREWASGFGLDLKIKGSLPGSFKSSQGRKVDVDTYERIVSKVNELWRLYP